MSLIHCLTFVLLIQMRSIALQVNFYHTNVSCDHGNSDHHKQTIAIQYDCLRAAASDQVDFDPRQVITYCITYCPDFSDDDLLNDQPRFTFDQLAEQSITAQQLYHWSAPIDLVESYQLFLNQKAVGSTGKHLNGIFYNCSWPRIGPRCQYSLAHLSDHGSLPIPLSVGDLVRGSYYNAFYQPTELTCYTHLQCDRGPAPSCLD